MSTMKVTLVTTLKIWWSLSWRCALFSTLLAMIVGFFGGLFATLMTWEMPSQQVLVWISYLSTLPVSIWVLHQILRKPFRGFRIAIVAADS